LYIDHRVVCTVLQTDNHTSTPPTTLVSSNDPAQGLHTLKSGRESKLLVSVASVGVRKWRKRTEACWACRRVAVGVNVVCC